MLGGGGGQYNKCWRGGSVSKGTQCVQGGLSE